MSGGSLREGLPLTISIREIEVPVYAASPGPCVRSSSSSVWDGRFARQKGSHIILTKRGHIATLSVPNHSQVAAERSAQSSPKAGVSVDQFIAA